MSNIITTKKFSLENTNSVLYIDYNTSDQTLSVSYFIDDYLDSKHDYDDINQFINYLREIRLDNAINWNLKDYIKDIMPYLYNLKKEELCN